MVAGRSMLGTKTMKISMHLGWKKGSSDQFSCLCEVSVAGTAMNLGGRALTPNISNQETWLGC